MISEIHKECTIFEINLIKVMYIQTKIETFHKCMLKNIVKCNLALVKGTLRKLMERKSWQTTIHKLALSKVNFSIYKYTFHNKKTSSLKKLHYQKNVS